MSGPSARGPEPESAGSETGPPHTVEIRYADGAARVVPVDRGQTILEAAEFHGAPIVNACQAGVCGTCVARRVAGSLTLSHSIGLSQAEKDAGRILACQTTVSSDCVIEVDYAVGDNAAGIVDGVARVVRVERLGPRAALLTLDASAFGEPIRYEAGQFAQLRVPGSASWRSYSFVRAAGRPDALEFLVRILPHGEMSDYISRRARPGDAIQLRGAKGAFTARESERPVVLIAGGTGLSAILAIAERLCARGPAVPITLYYGVRDVADLVLTERLDRLAADHPSFTWQGVVSGAAEGWTGATGMVADLLDPSAFHGGAVDIYLCGPPAMVDAVRGWLEARDLLGANLFFEKFSPSADGARREAARAPAPVIDPASLGDDGAGVAVVVGGSIAGIAAAKVLAATYARVVVVEKDPQHRKMEGRPGAAQGWHLHHLLIAGQRQIETIFPGILDEMVAAGAFKVDMGQQYRILLAGAWKKPIQSDIEIICAARPLLEWCLRRRLDGESNIQYLYESELTDLVIEPALKRVVGIVADCAGVPRVIAAELVIDASGKNSPLPDLLAAHGFDRPQLDADDINCFYSTMYHHVPPGRAWRDKVMVISYPYRPHQKYYAAQYFRDSRRTMLSTTLVGYDCYDPPRNAKEFREFARRMPTPLIGEELEGLEPASSVYNFRYPTMQRYLYHRLTDYPGGIVAIGDALSSADPVSGAGMTKAFLELGVLADLLRHADMRDRRTARAFYRRVNRLTDTIWSVIREQNLRFPWIRDAAHKRPPWAAIQNWYVDRLMEAMHESPDLYRLYMSVSHFVSPPAALIRPDVVLRVIGQWLGARLSSRPTLIERTFGARPGVVPAPRSAGAEDNTTPTSGPF